VQATPNANAETVESTTHQGLKFLDSLKQAKDKTYVTVIAAAAVTCH
jgi:hypothetical protein